MRFLRHVPGFAVHVIPKIKKNVCVIFYQGIIISLFPDDAMDTRTSNIPGNNFPLAAQLFSMADFFEPIT